MAFPIAPTDDDLAYFAKTEAGRRAPLDQSIKERMLVERAVIRRAIADALAAGYLVRLHDGESWATGLESSIEKVMAELNAADIESLYVFEPSRIAGQDGKYLGSMMLVYGNDGWDVIADNSMSLEPLLEGATAYAEELSMLV